MTECKYCEMNYGSTVAFPHGIDAPCVNCAQKPSDMTQKQAIENLIDNQLKMVKHQGGIIKEQKDTLLLVKDIAKAMKEGFKKTDSKIKELGTKIDRAHSHIELYNERLSQQFNDENGDFNLNV